MIPILLPALVLAQFAAPLPRSAPAGGNPRSFLTGLYRNAFRDLGRSDAEIVAKLNAAWRQLFEGDAAEERVYFPVGSEEAYIKDIGNDDVRTEGMSYGMMIAVQFGRQEAFDRLWRWASHHMRYADGPYKGLFAWQCDDRGNIKGQTPASDGEEYFATALFFAAGRWGSKGPIDYRKEADSILHAMRHPSPGTPAMFDPKEKQVVFVPNGDAAKFTDPSYHLPAFYELWARWAKEDPTFWSEAAARSRELLRHAADPTTGLYPDYSSFEGRPMRAPWDPRSTNDEFGSDAFRVAGNVAMDWLWFRAALWEPEQENRMLRFLAAQRPSYVSGYTLAGKPTVSYQSGGHVAMNAVAAMAASPQLRRPFVQALWDAPTPRGRWRYYDGMLYLFGLLHASGQYRIWIPK